MRTLMMTLTVGVRPLTEHELSCGGSVDLEDNGLTGLLDAPLNELLPSSQDLSDVVLSLLNNRDAVTEAFAGSNIFVTFAEGTAAAPITGFLPERANPDRREEMYRAIAKRVPGPVDDMMVAAIERTGITDQDWASEPDECMARVRRALGEICNESAVESLGNDGVYDVSQDGADFYIRERGPDPETIRHSLLAVITYPKQVKDWDLSDAMDARVWFRERAREWGWTVHMEGE